KNNIFSSFSEFISIILNLNLPKYNEILSSNKRFHLKLQFISIFVEESNTMKNILVTGGAGYIGSHTVIELIQQGYNPIILDDFRNSDGSIIERLEAIAKQKIRFHTVDVCNLNEIVNALSDIKIDGIIHFAAYKAVGESVQNPLKYYHNNIQGLVSILKFAEMQNVSNFIFSSSCTVYGEPNGIKEVTEDTNSRNANSPYGETKVVGEQILRDFHKSGSKINFLSLRYFNPIGAHPS